MTRISPNSTFYCSAQFSQCTAASPLNLPSKGRPLSGLILALSETFLINRSDHKSAVKAFEGAATDTKKKRQSVFIFPGGTKSYASGPQLGASKKGAFRLAVQAGLPVVLVVCANYWGMLSARERRFRGGRIPVKGGFNAVPVLKLWIEHVG